MGAHAGLHGPGRPARARGAASSAACASRATAPAACARTSARTPGPKEDRLRLTRATRANISPIFSLYSDPAERRLERAGSRAPSSAPWGEVTDGDGTVHRLWRVTDAAGDRRRAGGDARRRAADRRRPPPLRDDAGLRRGDRRRGRAPLHPDVPGRAGGPGPDGVPDAPPRQRARRRAPRRRWQQALERDFEIARGAARASSRPQPGERAAASSATSTHQDERAYPLDAEGPGDRRRRAERTLRGLPPPRHGRAGDAAAEGRARPERRRHLALQRPVLRARHRGGAGDGAPRASTTPRS